MLETTIIFPRETPSKKNSTTIKVVRGRVLHFPSTNFLDWHKAQIQNLKDTGSSFNVVDKKYVQTTRLHPPYKIKIILFPGTLRAGDLTNKAESLMDFLVDIGMIEDDNWFVNPDNRLLFGYVDKLNPRAKVTIISQDAPINTNVYYEGWSAAFYNSENPDMDQKENFYSKKLESHALWNQGYKEASLAISQ